MFVLSATKVIASALCETYAHNQSIMFWVINAMAPFAPTSASGEAGAYDDDEVSSARKGRGLGDCWISSVHT